jgi:hypothetical protein
MVLNIKKTDVLNILKIKLILMRHLKGRKKRGISFQKTSRLNRNMSEDELIYDSTTNFIDIICFISDLSDKDKRVVSSMIPSILEAGSALLKIDYIQGFKKKIRLEDILSESEDIQSALSFNTGFAFSRLIKPV